MWESIRYYATLTLIVLAMFAAIYPIMYWVSGLALQATLGG